MACGLSVSVSLFKVFIGTLCFSLSMIFVLNLMEYSRCFPNSTMDASACFFSSSKLLGNHQSSIQRQLNPSHTFPGLRYLKLKDPLKKGIKYRGYSFSTKSVPIVKALAVPVALPSAKSSSLDSAEYRKQLCESYGFRQIGEPLPENVTMKDIVNSLPEKLFVMGHDCAHKSFARNKLLEDVVGTAAFLPVIYPYESWRFKHDLHHAKTNMLFADTAWHPIWKEEIDSSPILRKVMVYGYGPIRPLTSIAHWLRWHFDLSKFRSNEVKRVKISLACVFAFMSICWPLIIYKTGIMGWIKFWLMPWLVYHFWISTFTMIHHTAPHIPFKLSEEWNAAQAQLNGTVHCDFPKWIEILCQGLNFHIPHHISPRIPSYNLRAAHRSLQENWGKYLNEATWNWRLMKTVMTICHVYEKEQNYVAFDELYEDAKPITFLKQVMPDCT